MLLSFFWSVFRIAGQPQEVTKVGRYLSPPSSNLTGYGVRTERHEFLDSKCFVAFVVECHGFQRCFLWFWVEFESV